MRFTTTLILAVVVLLAAVLIVVFREDLTGGRAEPESRRSEGEAFLPGVALDDVTEVRLEAADAEGRLTTKLAAVKKDEKWRLTEPVEGRADDYEVRRLLRGVLDAKRRSVISRPGAKGQPSLKDLDLDPPAFRLTFKAKAKGGETKTYTVDVGRPAAVGSGVYVRLDGAEEVVLLDTDDLLKRARRRLADYRDRNLLDLKRDEVVRMVLETPKATIRLDRAEDDPDRWVIAEPLSARADPDAASELLRTAVGLMVADFIKDGVEDFAPYGLDRPRLTLTLYKKAPEKGEEKSDEKGEKEAEGKKEAEKKKEAEPVPAAVLAFGGWADLKQESVYARLEGSASVVSVEKRDFAKLDKRLEDLRDRHVLALDTDRAVEVQVRLPAELAEEKAPVAYTLTKREGTWFVQTGDRKPTKADAGAVSDLLKELADLKVLYFAEGDRADLAKDFQSVGAVRVRLEKEPAPLGFEFGARKGDRPSLVRNIREEWVGRINEKDLQHLAKPWLALLDRQVLKFKKERAVRLAIRGPDRTNVFEKRDGEWTMTAPVEEKPRFGFVDDRLTDLADLVAEKVLAATSDFAKWNLAEGELAVTVTLEPEKPKPGPAPAPAKEAAGAPSGEGTEAGTTAKEAAGDSGAPGAPGAAPAKKKEAGAAPPAKEAGPAEGKGENPPAERGAAQAAGPASGGEKAAAAKTEKTGEKAAETPAPAKPKAEKAEDESAPAAPPKEAEPKKAGPTTYTLVLAHHEKGKAVGRLEGRDLVFQLPLSLLKDLASEPIDPEMVEMFSGDVRRIDLAPAEGPAVALVKVDDDWFWTDAKGRPDQEAPKTKVEDVVNAAVDLRAARWAAYKGAKPADYGLDRPVLRLTLTDRDGEKTSLLLSAKTVDAKVAALLDTTPVRYAMVEGAERVAVVAGKNVQRLLEAPETLAPPKPKPAPQPKEEPKKATPKPAGGAKPTEPAAGKAEKDRASPKEKPKPTGPSQKKPAERETKPAESPAKAGGSQNKTGGAVAPKAKAGAAPKGR